MPARIKIFKALHMSSWRSVQISCAKQIIKDKLYMGFANALCTYHTVGPMNYDWNQW